MCPSTTFRLRRPLCRYVPGPPAPGVQFIVVSPLAGGNCVVPHEQSVIDTSTFGGTSWVVDAVYIVWYGSDTS